MRAALALLFACTSDDPTPPAPPPTPVAPVAPVAPPEAPALEKPAAPEAPAAVTFEYTSAGEDACTSTQTGTDPIEFTQTCPGVGPYTLQIVGHDHGSELEILHKGDALGLSYDAPGWMSDVTTGKVEWRTRAGADGPHALIFRVTWTEPTDDGNTQHSTLIVARIQAGTACEIGRSGSNETARTLADDATKRCG